MDFFRTSAQYHKWIYSNKSILFQHKKQQTIWYIIFLIYNIRSKKMKTMMILLLFFIWIALFLTNIRKD